jgi:thiol:disulfide interchange protein
MSLGALLAMSVLGFAEWTSDYSQALKTAKAQNKPVLADFTGSDWCGWCMKLDREVFSTSEFKSFADKNLVLLKVDFPRGHRLPASVTAQNEKLASRYGVRSFPTVLVLHPDGKVAGKLGYQPGGPRSFISAVEKTAQR